MCTCKTFICVLVIILAIIIYRSNHPKTAELTTWNEHMLRRDELSNWLIQLNKQDSALPPLTIKRKIHAASTRFQQEKNKLFQIDVSGFNKVISINKTDMTAWVESSCNMEYLIDTLLPYNLMPKVVPEFKHITVGGAVQGIGIESTSFKYGLFHDIATKYEILLTNGSVINVTHEIFPNIFYAIPGSLNTLAIVIAVEISVIHAKPWVLVEYKNVDGINVLYNALRSSHRKYMDENDFFEIIRHRNDNNKFVQILGTFKDEKDEKYSAFDMSNYWHELYYRHVFNIVSNTDVGYEYIKIRDYLFRHDRASFWAGTQAMYVPNHILFRFVAYWMMDSKRMFKYRNRRYNASKPRNEEWLEHKMSVHDYIIADHKFLEFYHLVDKHYNNGYLWFCFVYVDDNDARDKYNIFTKINSKSNLAINIGVYLENNHKTWYETFDTYHGLEMFLCNDNAGISWYYAPSYLSEQQFWECYDSDKYNQIRNELNANLPNIYSKVGKIGSKYKNIKQGFDLDWDEIDPYETHNNWFKIAIEYVSCSWSAIFDS